MKKILTIRKTRRYGVLCLVIQATGACLLSGCATVYYGPNSHNVPLFREKGESRVEASLNEDAGIFDGTQGADFQGAYAVTNNVGVMANIYFAGKSDKESGEGGKGRLFEFGAGYYRPVSDRFVFETYGGAGFGRLTHTHRNGSDGSSVNAERIFLQPSIGLTSRAFDAAFSLRVCGLNYSGIPERITDFADAQEAPAAQELRDNKSSFLVEPALTLRAGWKHLKLQLQFGLSKNLTHPDFPQIDSYASIGVSVAMKR